MREWSGRQLEDWRWENDEKVLRTALDTGVNYPEYVVIVHRLRELTNKPHAAIEWEEQIIDDALMDDLQTHVGQLRAIFLQESVSIDNIVYCEYKPLRVPEFKQGGWQLPLDTVLSAATMKQLRDEDEAIDIEGLTAEQLAELIQTHEVTLTEGERIALADNRHQGERVAYSSKREEAWTMFADIDVGEAEQETVQKLTDAGAMVATHKLQVEDYHRSGKRFQLTTPDGAVVHYVPHAAIGEREVSRFEHRMTWRGSTVTNEQLQDLVRESFQTHRVRAEDVLITIDHYDRPYRQPRVLLHQKNRMKPERLEAMQQAADEGIIERRGEDSRRARHVQTLQATPDRLRRFASYYTDTGDDVFMYHRAHRAEQRLLRAISMTETMEFTIHWDSEWDDPPQMGVGAAAKEVAKNFRKALRTCLLKETDLEPFVTDAIDPDDYEDTPHSIAADLVNILSLHGAEALFDHDVKSVARMEEIIHDAPYSERGVLRVDYAQPHRALEIIRDLGLAGNICPEVPFEPIYRGRHRRGRVLSWHPDYALGAADISLPDGELILHGLTGIGGASRGEALQRLETIIQTGGLKSIAERRRMNMKILPTMSPVGDIGSGTDVGVPTRISSAGCPGSSIYFVINENVLCRKELFFSDRDFGGHEQRYENYEAYAKKIGQGGFHKVAPHQARIKHLKHGLGGSNELYLRHEIPWEEVEALFVVSGLYEKAVELVKKYQATGDLPEQLQVQRISQSSIDKTAREWISERERTPGVLHV